MKRFMIQRSKIRKHAGGAFCAGTVNRKVVDHFKFTDLLHYTRGQARYTYPSIYLDEHYKRDRGFNISMREIGSDCTPTLDEVIRRNARRRFLK